MGIQDPDLTTVSFGYDASFANRLTSRTDRRGTVTTYAFDAGNKVAQASINMGTGQAAINTTLTALESRGLPGSSTPSSVDTAVANSRFNGARTDVGDTTLFWLDRFGAPRKIVDALGNATLLNRGDARWPALVTRLQYPSGQVTGATYDTLRGNLLTITDSSTNATTSYQWDPNWDAVQKTTRPAGDSVTSGYDPVTGNLLWQQDGRGSLSRVNFSYNAANQPLTITYPNTPAEQIGYDALGNLASTTTPKGYVTTYQNDAIGRPTLISSPIDTVASSTRRQVQEVFYDNADRDTLTIAAGPAMGTVPVESLFVKKGYTPNGTLDSLSRWARPDVARVGTISTHWKYDAASRAIAEIAPDGLVDSTYYDGAGNDTLVVTRRQVRIGMAYDARNQLTTRDRKSTRLNSSHGYISYAVFCLKKKKTRMKSSHGYISYAVFCLKKKKKKRDAR